MVKSKKTFALGDLVFAKVKGYKPWPAKVTKVHNKSRFGVYFYGTGETANIKVEDLDAYDVKSRARYVKDSAKGGYKEALDQIELALNGDDPAPILDDDQAQEGNDDTMLDESGVVEENLEISQDFGTHEVSKKLKVKPEILENVSTVKTSPVIKKKTKTPPVEITDKPKEEDAPKTSRSGRIITKNKTIDDIEDSKPSAPKQMKADSTMKDDILMSKRRPDSNRELLQTQYDMIVLIQQIKMALGLEQADSAKCLMILDEIKALCPNLNKFVLLKYPNCVEVIKRLKKYIGNILIWTMDDEEQKEFEVNASLIRERATDIYGVFKSFFEIGEDESFWQKFTIDLKDFESQTANIKFECINEMCTFEDLMNYKEL